MKFKYRARASSSEMVEGTVEADDQKSALSQLRGVGMIVINLNAQGGGSSQSQNYFQFISVLAITSPNSFSAFL